MNSSGGRDSRSRRKTGNSSSSKSTGNSSSKNSTSNSSSSNSQSSGQSSNRRSNNRSNDRRGQAQGEAQSGERRPRRDRTDRPKRRVRTEDAAASGATASQGQAEGRPRTRKGNDRPRGEKSGYDKTKRDKTRNENTTGDKPRSEKPRTGKPRFEKSRTADTAGSDESRGEGRPPRPRGGRRKDYRRGSKAKQQSNERQSAAKQEQAQIEAVARRKRTLVPEGATVPFASLGLAQPIAETIESLGYQFATPIQAATIPAALDGRDVLGSAQTGTGKTAAFALPILSQMSGASRKAESLRPFSLMLAPTRELAAQIQDSVNTYGAGLRLRSAVIFGGVGQGNQVAALQRGVHILIATPGRLLDLMDQGYIDLSSLETFVLDEADRMLDMGFLPDLKRIIASLPEQRQSLFFSATISKEIKQLTDELLRDPFFVDVTPPERSVELIEQSVQFVRRGEKLERLVEVLSGEDVGQAVVFTRTKRGANAVSERLIEAGISAEAIHGNKSQNARLRTLNGFRVGRIQVLVATDLAARGLDIDDVTHVVNYELPNEPESYVHRIGRTGRAGASGKAITFCDANEKDYLRAIEALIGQPVPVDGEDNVGYERPEPIGNRRAASSGRSGRRPQNRRSGPGRGSDSGSSEGRFRRPRNSESGSGRPRRGPGKPSGDRRRGQ